jgi:hypothetical protein
LQQAVSAGADLVVDGSQRDLPEKGWYMGMSLLDHVLPEMALHTECPNVGGGDVDACARFGCGHRRHQRVRPMWVPLVCLPKA